MNHDKTRNICLAALFTAMITTFTAGFRFSIGANSGYIHLGDAVIYLAACLLPPPYAIFSAAAGGMTSDLLAGAGIWVIPTGMIKAMNTLPFFLFMHRSHNKYNDHNKKIINFRTIVSCIISGVITSGGYFAAECLIYGFKPAVISFFPGLLQPVGSAVLFICAGTALDSANIRSRFSFH